MLHLIRANANEAAQKGTGDGVIDVTAASNNQH
jgi:hypothetical protein